MRKNKPRLNLIRNSFLLLFTTPLVLLFVFQLSCSFDEPVAPKWDVNLPVPLMNRSLTMQELIDENDFLITNSENLVSIDFEEDLERYEVGDELKVEGIHEHFDSELGEFRVPSPGAKTTSLTFGQIYPPAYALDGQTATVAAFSYEDVSADLPPFDQFESILIESGYIQITISNRLPVPLSAGLSLEIKEQGTDQLIHTIQFDQEIPAGSTETKNVSLMGVRIPSDLKVSFTGGSPGSGGESVQINADTDGVDIETYISDIVAAEASAVVEDQEFSGRDSLVLGDSIIVTEATIDEGIFRFQFENNIPLDLRLTLQLEDFYNQNNEPMQLDIPIQSRESTSRYINVSGYEFRPKQTSEGSLTKFNWTAFVYGSDGNIITMSNNDKVQLDVELSRLSFSELHGILNNIKVELEPFEESIDMPEGMDSLRFESARLEIIINNGISFPISPDLKVVGINESSGKIVELPISQQIQPANGEPVETTIALDENNSRIIEFLNVSPNQLQVSGSVMIGNGSTESVIRNTDFLESAVHITMPLSLSFPSQSVETDVDTVEIEEDAQDELGDNVLSGKLYAELGNHLPFGFQVFLQFSSKDTCVFTDPELTIGPLTLMPGSVSSSTGRVTSEYPSEIVVDLTQEEISLFANDEIYSGISATIPGSEGQIRKVYADDYLNVKAYCEFKYHVDPENMSE